jgi:hypothetical protein
MGIALSSSKPVLDMPIRLLSGHGILPHLTIFAARRLRFLAGSDFGFGL